jgi:hypothetical protein
VCDYQFTDKEEEDFIKRNKGKTGWLDTEDTRSGNMPRQKTRYLGKKICDDHKIAFDNKFSPQDKRYRICFDLINKDRMIAELDCFDNLVLIHSSTIDIPSKSLLSYEATLEDLFHWNALKVEWIEVYKAFCRYQNGGKIEDFSYFHYAAPLPDSNEKNDRKDAKKYTSLKIHTFINLYKALRIGWGEIENSYKDDTYNTLFIKILTKYYEERFVQRTNPDDTQQRYRNHLKNIVIFKDFPEKVRCEIERLSNDKELDDSGRELYRLILEEYDRDPHGQGFENAVDALKKVSSIPHIRDILWDFHRATLVLGKAPNGQEGTSFDYFLQCFGVGEFLFDYDPKSDEASVVDRVLYQIREALRASSDPRVRGAVSDWVEAESKILDFDAKISGRKRAKL